MKKTIKAFLIDPFEKEIVEVILKKSEEGGYLEAYCGEMNCKATSIGMVVGEGADDLIVDEEGFYVDDTCAFGILNSVFFGKALLVGRDQDDDEADCLTSKEELNKALIFFSKEQSEKMRKDRLRQGPNIIGLIKQ